MPDTPRSQAAEPARPVFDVPGMHSVSFQRNTLNGRFRGMCTCGWFRSGPARDEDAIRNEAACHDIRLGRRRAGDAVSESKPMQPWCCLCGQRHSFAVDCDPARLEWVYRRRRKIAEGTPSDATRFPTAQE